MDHFKLIINEGLIIDSLGWLGAFCFLISYYLLVSKKWKSDSFPYHLLNILGGLFVAINTYYYQSIPGAFINIAWAGIALYGMINDRKNGNPATTN